MENPSCTALFCWLGFISLSCQAVGLTTIPSAENGRTPVVAAAENSTNVTVFCRVNFNQMVTQTTWFLNSFILQFQSSGEGEVGFENYFVTGESLPGTTTIARSNLTIRNFDSSLDMALLECAVGNDVAANFTLRLISELTASVRTSQQKTPMINLFISLTLCALQLLHCSE